MAPLVTPSVHGVREVGACTLVLAKGAGMWVRVHWVYTGCYQRGHGVRESP